MPIRPFDPASPWNTPIPANPVVLPNSAALITAISDNNQPLTCDPDAYTIPVYEVANLANTPKMTVTGSGYYSTYDAGDASRVGHGSPWKITAPLPANLAPPAGSDAQVSIWDTTGLQLWEFWQLSGSGANWTAANGWCTHTGVGYHGRFADGKAGRGAGTPYLAGLVRPWEVVAGIQHALAFAYKSPAHQYVYPASKTDGAGTAADVPEGTRLQLVGNPVPPAGSSSIAQSLFFAIVTALKVYGMFVIDNSGSSKIYLEHRSTAKWDASITRHLTETIPWSAFRAVAA